MAMNSDWVEVLAPSVAEASEKMVLPISNLID